ncbi:MAG: D-alanyl-D-alanine carboxypeptidase/D-alanyl-D-alanine-endopeptidase [Ferruginibacter sp.]
MKLLSLFIIMLFNVALHAQSITTNLNSAVKKLELDSQFEHALLGLYVVNNSTGAVVFEKNSQIGMAPASTQKIITSATAFELLGADYRYRTAIDFKATTTGNYLVVKGSGDPSFGSWRWEGTDSKYIFSSVVNSLKQKGIFKLNGSILFSNNNWETQATPRGWTWEDMGNYYGAGARAFNWNENQYTLTLQPGKKIKENVTMLNMSPASGTTFSLKNELTTGTAGSGDQSIIYAAEGSYIGYVRGTVPAGEASFKIKGSMPFPDQFFTTALKNNLTQKGILFDEEVLENTSLNLLNTQPLTEVVSPSLDSMNYWFMRESINLYGEAFVKTIAMKQKNVAATDTGLAIIRYFWSSRGISASALNILDGSGLSPANRITPTALVKVLLYAAGRPWYKYFYEALPTMNGIKMKSGYIGGVRSYVGYIKSKTGETYSFAFIINNFDGSAAMVREKMYSLLNLLK